MSYTSSCKFTFVWLVLCYSQYPTRNLTNEVLLTVLWANIPVWWYRYTMEISPNKCINSRQWTVSRRVLSIPHHLLLRPVWLSAFGTHMPMKSAHITVRRSKIAYVGHCHRHARNTKCTTYDSDPDEGKIWGEVVGPGSCKVLWYTRVSSRGPIFICIYVLSLVYKEATTSVDGRRGDWT